LAGRAVGARHRWHSDLHRNQPSGHFQLSSPTVPKAAPGRPDDSIEPQTAAPSTSRRRPARLR
jgi:hypothetical protein